MNLVRSFVCAFSRSIFRACVRTVLISVSLLILAYTKHACIYTFVRMYGELEQIYVCAAKIIYT